MKTVINTTEKTVNKVVNKRNVNKEKNSSKLAQTKCINLLNEIIKQEFVDFRHDRYGEKIIKGSKKHKIVFIDKLKNNCNLVEKIDVVSYKNLNYLNTQHERDQSSRCKIGMCCFLY